MTGPIRVYVNARAVEVAADATLLDAVRAADAPAAELVAAGERALADSRGLPVSPGERAFAGAIVRVVSGRRAAGGAPPA
jgi:hypothetical protein